MLNRYLDISTEVKEALEQGKPVVALESTIISHGMPYPQNVETAMNVEKLIRENAFKDAKIDAFYTSSKVKNIFKWSIRFALGHNCFN